MRKLITYTLGTVVMVGVYYCVRYLVTGISSQFGDGFALGVVLTLLVLWAGQKAERSGY
jgi:hypothetical protein